MKAWFVVLLSLAHATHSAARHRLNGRSWIQ